MSIATGQIISDNIYKGNREVNKIYKGNQLVYPSPTPDKFDYFHVYATGGPAATDPTISAGMIHYELGANMETPSLEISSDGINWEPWTAGLPRALYINYDESTGEPIYSYIFLRGTNHDGFNKKIPDQPGYGYNRIVIQGDDDANIHVGGNIMSLLYGDLDFREYNTIPSIDCFYTLFQGTDIYDASELKLPATTLKTTCYAGMFASCEKMIYSPKVLPANELANSCYRVMFGGCTNLIKAPVLPAQNLAASCYSTMFYNCTSLEKAPLLPAKNLVDKCYLRMFEGCTSLNYIKMIAETGYDIVDRYGTGPLNDWVLKIVRDGIFIKKSGVNIPTGRHGIPEGWTVEEID